MRMEDFPTPEFPIITVLYKWSYSFIIYIYILYWPIKNINMILHISRMEINRHQMQVIKN